MTNPAHTTTRQLADALAEIAELRARIEQPTERTVQAMASAVVALYIQELELDRMDDVPVTEMSPEHLRSLVVLGIREHWSANGGDA